MDTKDEKETEPRLPASTPPPATLPETTHTTPPAEAPAAAVATPPPVVLEVGDFAFLTTTISKGDGGRVRALTYVRVKGVEPDGRYRLDLGRGLSTVCERDFLEAPPAGGYGGRVLFVLGDVVELEEKKA